MLVDILLNQIQKVHFSSEFEHSAFHQRHKVPFGIGGPCMQKYVLCPTLILFYGHEIYFLDTFLLEYSMLSFNNVYVFDRIIGL
jgi:hypothetical protein